jgi:hypothetical protein
VFLANSKEAIWQLMLPMPSSTYATPDGNGFILQGAPGAGALNSTILTQSFLNTFENGDKRLTAWVSSYTTTSGPTINYYYPSKYKVRTSSGPGVSEYEMVLRLAEQYLIRAEAEAEEGDLLDAASDVDVIRTRAGLANLSDTISSSKQMMLAAILRERQIELFTEWGSRWFDLVRTGAVDSVVSALGPIKNSQWIASDSLYPIPQSDILLNGNLTQNPGY